MDTFKLCTQSDCIRSTEISKYAEHLRSTDKYVLVLGKSGPYISNENRHDAAHYINFICEDSSIINHHAACIHNSGRIYALYQRNINDNDGSESWIKIKSNYN